MTTTKATFGLRDRNDDIPNIIASRDDVEQSYTDDGINHHNHQRQTMSSTYQSSSRRYPLPPSKPRYIDHHIKKLKNIQSACTGCISLDFRWHHTIFSHQLY